MRHHAQRGRLMVANWGKRRFVDSILFFVFALLALMGLIVILKRW